MWDALEKTKADVKRFLDDARAKGSSLIVRLGYTWSEQKGCEPNNFGIVLGHVRDLSKIMSDYDDVVVGVEAGIAGPWGEMHSSDYCRPEYMNPVLKTYCDNLSSNISILVRTASYIAAYAGTKSDGLLAMLPFQDGHMKRFGMYNDGYLGTWRDYGTWAGEWRREKGCQLLKALDDHPYGGELAYVKMDWLEGNRERCAELLDAATEALGENASLDDFEAYLVPYYLPLDVYRHMLRTDRLYRQILSERYNAPDDTDEETMEQARSAFSADLSEVYDRTVITWSDDFVSPRIP